MTQTSEPKPFGPLLRKLRKNAGLTQQELSVSRRSIDYYERESQQPPAHLLAILYTNNLKNREYDKEAAQKKKCEKFPTIMSNRGIS